MKLYINGQDIQRLVLGDLETEELVTFEVRPEEYLATLSGFLEERQIAPIDVEEIYVVVGPGSPTALRAILSILNTMSFVYAMALYPILKEPEMSDDERLRLLEGEELKSEPILSPVYNRGNGVTISEKDQLGR